VQTASSSFSPEVARLPLGYASAWNWNVDGLDLLDKR
jgi:hypothetical protein